METGWIVHILFIIFWKNIKNKSYVIINIFSMQWMETRYIRRWSVFIHLMHADTVNIVVVVVYAVVSIYFFVIILFNVGVEMHISAFDRMHIMVLISMALSAYLSVMKRKQIVYLLLLSCVHWIFSHHTRTFIYNV